MSAFVVSDKHLSYMVSAAKLYQMYYGEVSEPAEVVAMLRAENLASVDYRYRGSKAGDDPRPKFTPLASVDPVVVLKSVQCYEYQSCEHDGWKDSEAYKFCQRLKSQAISKLPGYNAAPWGID